MPEMILRPLSLSGRYTAGDHVAVYPQNNAAAVSALGKAGQWQQALSLLEYMRKAGISPYVCSFSSAISLRARRALS